MEETLPMRNHSIVCLCPRRGIPTIDNLKDSSFSLDCRVGSLMRMRRNVAVALRDRCAVVPRPHSPPRQDMHQPTRRAGLAEGKVACGGTNFGNDLLC